MAHGDEDRLQVTAGAGVAARPDFPGSDSLEVLPMPAFNVVYDQRWFLNADGVGAYLINRERGSLTLSLAPDITRRDESDSAHLRGLGDVDRTAIARLKSDEYAEQSQRSALSQYQAQSGFGDTRLFVNAVYALSPRWIVTGDSAAASLQGDAEDDSYFQFDAALLYRF